MGRKNLMLAMMEGIMALEGLKAAIELSKVSKPAKEEGKHYIPFSKAEWTELEKVAGPLEPKDLKRMIQMIFNGEAKFEVLAKPEK